MFMNKEELDGEPEVVWSEEVLLDACMWCGSELDETGVCTSCGMTLEDMMGIP